jgi:hypothetical protein
VPVPDHHTARQPRCSTFWLTTINDQGGHTDHVVGHDEFAAGSGTYTATCGSVIHPVPMTVPPGRPCRRCLTNREPSPQPPGRHTRRRWPRAERAQLAAALGIRWPFAPVPATGSGARAR